MGYNKLTARSYGFINNRLNTIKRNKCLMYFLVGVAYYKACIVIVFLVSQRGQAFKVSGKLSEFHNCSKVAM